MMNFIKRLFEPDIKERMRNRIDEVFGEPVVTIEDGNYSGWLRHKLENMPSWAEIVQADVKRAMRSPQQCVDAMRKEIVFYHKYSRRKYIITNVHQWNGQDDCDVTLRGIGLRSDYEIRVSSLDLLLDFKEVKRA